MTANQIRKKYLDFMASKGYKKISPVDLILRDDPTTLFTGSGMQPMVPYLLGQKHPEGDLLTNSQPCIRTQDMTEVGDNRHTTFFEMLGDWSLRGLDKKQQIEWLFEFLTENLGLDPKRLYITCFIGDTKNNIPRDNETAEIWQTVFEQASIKAKLAEIGSSKNGDKRGMRADERIFFYDDSQNWWSRNGGTDSTPIGDPCGPDNEVFYDFGADNHDPSFGAAHPASDSGRFMEICNKVWMQYARKKDGSFELLETGKVDFGGGLSRLLAAANNAPDIFATDLYQPIISELEKLSNQSYNKNQTAMRVVADHLTGAVWLASQDLIPSNKEQGYVMRRLTRRAILQAFDLGVKDNFLGQCVPKIVEIYRESYPELASVCSEIAEVLIREEKAFRKTLNRGLREFDRIVGQKGFEKFDDEALVKSRHILSGQEVFKLMDTYGFPTELTIEEAGKRQIKLSENWQSEFDAALANQRAMSQTAAKGTYKGGLTGDGEIHKKYHTATHMLGAALRQVLQSPANQRGSNINDERLRLDFSYPEKLTPEQLEQVEDLVNQKIAENLPVSFAEYDTDYALEKLHAIGEFRDKYDDKVIVYTIGQPDEPFSVDICGGPHVTATGQLGHFKIKKEESSSAGVRRIKAVLE
ncbi:MAG: alanine--tRNA ligase [Candidatus Nomurabacteria bacterium]|jgi:alanyl-tRNA synthetase|nr:alanine--tRNA ligase [Candidatus Nomurabacteria bacterium]